MGKTKVHEIAKKLGINSKEVLEKAQELGIDVKSHLSVLEDNDAKKIEECFGRVKKETIEKEKNNASGPVIIRRQVIMENEKEEKKQSHTTPKKGVGFVENERKKDYNIVYRNRPTKPMTVSELFGNSKSQEQKKDTLQNNEIKHEEKNETTEVKQENKNNNIQSGVKEENITNVIQIQKNQVNNRENKPSNRDNNRPFIKDSRNGFNSNRQYNRENNNYNNQNKPYKRENNSYNSQNRQFNRDGKNGSSNYNNQNRSFNNRFGGRRSLDEKGVEKNIKNIMSTDVAEKENTRDYASKAIDKQKNNNKYDENKNTKKASKTRKNNYDDYSSHKLKDLKQEDRLSNMFTEGSMLDYYDLSTTRGKRSKKRIDNIEERNKQKIFQLTEITIPESISVKDLSTELKKTSGEIIKKLLSYGIMATINNEVDFDTAFLIAQEFGVTAVKKEVISDEDKLFDESIDREEDLMPRPPVVVVMGHVDHGKTSLLDAVRQTNVIEGEAGGITQAIGAYKVKINDREITFLDTPGHEAFTAMRARGAQITDIAILVVAANDGVMPQTVEAINHAKAADIPIVVAINKIDVEGANPQKVKQDLMEYGLVAEEWGGDTIFVEISAKKKINIDGLLEMVLLVADMKELKANPNKQAKGVVIEAKLDKTKGPVATVLVQRGTLDAGDTIIVGSTIGRIRTMTDENGKKIKKAGPSTPVEITGFSSVPEAGETFYEVKDEKTAKHLIETRKRKEREKALGTNARVTLEDLFGQIEKGNLKQLNLIVKADVQGSVEAVKSALEKLSNDEVQVKVIHANVGAVTESDVTLADVSNAIIIAFNVRPEPLAKDKADKTDVDIKTYSVIYNAIEDVEAAMKGLLDPVYKEVVIGTAEVRQLFKISNVGTIAGCYVTSGKVARNAGVRVIRDNVVIHEGKLVSLKRMKDDAKEVNHGFECGIQIENFNDLQEMDVIEAFIMEQVK